MLDCSSVSNMAIIRFYTVLNFLFFQFILADSNISFVIFCGRLNYEHVNICLFDVLCLHWQIFPLFISLKPVGLLDFSVKSAIMVVFLVTLSAMSCSIECNRI